MDKINNMERPTVSKDSLLKAIETVTTKLGYRLETKGDGAYVSNHESLGIITEEYLELVDAVRSNDIIEIGNELHDVAVGCVFAIASLYEQEAQLIAVQTALESVVS